MLFSSKIKKSPYWIQKTHFLRDDEYICSSCGFKAKKAYKSCPSCESQIAKTVYDPSWVEEAELFDMISDDCDE